MGTKVLIVLLAVGAFLAPTATVFAQSIPVRDANGALVGLYAGGGGPDLEQGPPQSFGPYGPAFRVVSQQGYMAVFGTITGRLTVGFNVLSGFYSGANVNQGLFFESQDCTGQAWISVNTPGGPATGGFVIATLLPTYLPHYVPKTAVSQALVYRSSLTAGGCSAQGPSNTVGLPAFVNDPAVTGIPNAPYQPPLTLGYSDTLWLLFRDEFESAAVDAGTAVVVS